MSAFRPQTRKYGDLPNLSSIPRKPEPLGMEFKVIVCAVTGIVVWLELQRGKYPMREAEFARESGVTAACTLRGCRDAKRLLLTEDNVANDEDPNEIFSVKFPVCYQFNIMVQSPLYNKVFLMIIESLVACLSVSNKSL